MITKYDYDTLDAIRQLQDGFYIENKKPKFLEDRDYLARLFALGYLERFTLEPFREDAPQRAAIVGVRVSLRGEQELLLFEKESSEKMWQLLQFFTATFLALGAIPEISSFAKWLIDQLASL